MPATMSMGPGVICASLSYGSKGPTVTYLGYCRSQQDTKEYPDQRALLKGPPLHGSRDLLRSYRGAEPPNPKKCSRGCLGKCRPEVGCSGGCLGGCSGRCSGGCSGPIFCAKTRRTSTLPSTLPSTFPSTPPSTLPSTPPRAATEPQAPPGALFGVRGFGTL